jgi:PAS domain S-box-containing protein
MKKKSDGTRRNNSALQDTVNRYAQEQPDEKLKAIEERFRLLCEAAEEGIIIHDNGIIIEANQAMARMFGYELSELIGKNAEVGVTSESWKVILDNAAAGYDKPYEITGVRKDGSTFICSVVGKPYKYQGRSLRVALFRDVTERRRMEEALRKSEEKYREFIKYASIGIYEIDYATGKLKGVNDILCEYAEYTRDELLDMNFYNLFTEESRKLMDERLKKLYSGEKISPSVEYCIRTKSGKEIWIRLDAQYIYDRGKLQGSTGIVHNVTERRQAEKLLQKSEAQYGLLADHMKDQVWLLDLDFKITYISPSVEKISGYTPEEIKKLPLDKLITEASLKSMMDVYSIEMSKALSNPQPASYTVSAEFEFRHKDGHIFPVEATLSFIQDENGKPLYILGESRDITERKQAEEKLLFEGQRFRSLADNSLDIIFLTDTKGAITYMNPSIERVLGYKVEERLGKSSLETIHPDDLQSAVDKLKILATDTNAPVLQMEMRLRHKDGSWRLCETVGSNLIKDNAVETIIIRQRDITERKLAEESLQKSEAQYRLLADHMKDQIWLMDLNLKWTYISPSVEKLWGYTLEELMEIPLDKLLTEASFPIVMEFFSIEMPTALAAIPPYSLKRLLEFELCCKDGMTLWIESTFSIIRDENGNPLSLLCEGRNITERKQMEASLQKSEENFRHSLDDSPLGVRISTIEGETIYANRAILDIYGYDSMEELKAIQLKDRYTPESYAEFQIRKEKRVKGEFGPSEYEISIVRKDGEIRHLHVFRKEIFWNGKKQSQVIYQDITLRRQAEGKLNEILGNLRQSIKTTIQVLGTASEARDPYTAGHQRRVADLARAIATEMKLPHDKIEAIRMAAAIHDIGKISVPSEILCKPSILSELEFSLIKNHVQYSYEIIKDVESPWPLADIVHQHHERMDGSGYPLGLKNKDILIEARILAVADVVEAMMSYRPYRPALGFEIAMAEIENNTGTLYDRDAVDACLRLFRNKNYQMA